MSTGEPNPATAEVVAELARVGVRDVDTSTLTRALYSADASLYRVVPEVVVRPRHRDELEAVLAVAQLTGTPLTARGAGTSIAGNAVGPGIVIDCARHLDQVLEIDAEARTARVEPGVVQAALQAAAAPFGLRFGPDPSTHTRCTIGGMIGNNACGSRALGYGRTSDNVVALDALFPAGNVAADLTAVVAAELAHVRTTFGRFSRQVSGYALEHLLPERHSLPTFLVGSEGTLALIREATVSLVAEEARTLQVLGFASMAEAADAVPAVLSEAEAAGDARLIACEGLDSRIVELVRTNRAVPELPPGAGWLFVEVAGAGASDLLARLPAASATLGARVVTDAAEAAALWRIREDGAGLATRSLSRPAHAGWEDAAVPPEHLGAWLRDFDELLTAHGLDAVPYGHFGDGCVHARIDFDFSHGSGPFKDFLVACATRLADYGGSLSGEHGDGRARSELLPLMYDERSLALFRAVKHACDPDGILNPGVLVDPAPVTADLRPTRARHELGIITEGVHRCTGVGKCVAPAPGGVMCPSFLATRDEKDSTRGRARVLQESLDGGTFIAGLGSSEVHEALDLCLSCKGCLSDCPTGVDLATYKSIALDEAYRHRRRPRTHYTLGRLPHWLSLGSGGGSMPTKALKFKVFQRMAKSMAGIDQRRSIPLPAARSLRHTHSLTPPLSDVLPDVWIWADTFTDHFGPHTAAAAIRVLAAAGLTAHVIPEYACCGLTWITTGQRQAATKLLNGAVHVLAPYVASGAPVIGLEPSCLATMRSDALEMVPDAATQHVAAGLMTLAEFLTGIDWQPPDLSGRQILAQPHCHQAAVLGFEADIALLTRAGAEVTTVQGCCGLAGNFGMERGHYEVSVAVAETYLLPALRAAPDAVLLADGMSCRVQAEDLAGAQPLHLAELLAKALPKLET